MALNKPSLDTDLIAKEATVENVQSITNTINTTLGNFAGGGTDSVVTELNALKDAVAALTTKTDGLQTDVTNIKTDVGTIETTVEQIAGQSGGIKRVQRGKVDKKSQNSPSVNITLDYPVDVNKTFVLAFGLGASNRGDPNEGGYSYFPCATLENANTIQVKGGTSLRARDGRNVYDIYVAWQVIEFY